jgi:hypothetical protein
MGWSDYIVVESVKIAFVIERCCSPDEFDEALLDYLGEDADDDFPTKKKFAVLTAEDISKLERAYRVTNAVRGYHSESCLLYAILKRKFGECAVNIVSGAGGVDLEKEGYKIIELKIVN